MGSLQRLLVGVLATVFVVGAATSAMAKPGKRGVCRDRGDTVYPLTLVVDGEQATGRYSLPSGSPTGLVVFGHGYGHTSYSWDHHMRAAAERGLVAVTMDYRGLQISPDANGDGLPESRGWPAMKGAEDLLAAARVFEAACRPGTVTIMGVSMGGNMTGLAVALAGERGITKRDGTPLFDYFVFVEGVANVIETYAGARTLAPVNAFARNAQQDIEAEMGGPIEQRADAYRDRSVVLRMDDVAAAGLDGVVVLHGLDDGLVPYNQGREFSLLLRTEGIPTEMFTIGRKDEDSERETTLTGYVGGQLDPSYTSPLAGHSSEKSTTHIVMQTSLARLWTLVAGEAPADRECLVNGQVPAQVASVCSPA